MHISASVAVMLTMQIRRKELRGETAVVFILKFLIIVGSIEHHVSLQHSVEPVPVSSSRGRSRH